MTCPHCLGLGCLHCREWNAELSLQRRRSTLTDLERASLQLLSYRPPKLPAKRPQSESTGMVPVLPADFVLVLKS
jgi:hypothetical protein